MTTATATQQTEPAPPNTEKGLTVRQKQAATIERLMEDRSAKLLQVMPKGMDPDRFMRTTLTAISRDPKLLDCTPESLVIAIFEAAECGINPTGSLGRGYLVPLADHGVQKAHFWIGYPGLIELAMRSERVSKVWSRPVFKGDDFEVRYGTDDKIVHVPQLGTDDTYANLTHVYACVKYVDGTVDFEVLTKEQVELVRAQARGSNKPDSPWQTSPIEQGRKTAIRKLAKRLPLTSEAASAIQRDEEREFGFEAKRQKTVEAEKRADSLGDELRKRAGRNKPASANVTPQDERETQDEQSATPIVSATQQAGDVGSVAETDSPAPTSQEPLSEIEQVEGEIVCGDESPYEDGATCVLTADHKAFHKGATGATWGGKK